ncbi:hypothetical protein D9V37_16060 [Nocardioides mangrovicus]|uniref:Uncharacterized protein n=1 Tax=Nocardioides mangrovicus TaxID=2478913 RepID=A0A3L8NXL7_9ACTN|nr:hypothetical protein D9V37_16060 [Nocardioides mangrovicus]
MYERAYRRAYEQGLGGAATSVDQESPTLPIAPRRGRRVAVPRQRSSPETTSVPRSQRRGGARRAGVPVRESAPVVVEPPAEAAVVPVVAEPEPEVEVAVAPAGRHRHRGVPRTGSTWVPLLVLLALALMLIAGAFVLGRVTADNDLATAPRITSPR